MSIVNFTNTPISQAALPQPANTAAGTVASPIARVATEVFAESKAAPIPITIRDSNPITLHGNMSTLATSSDSESKEVLGIQDLKSLMKKKRLSLRIDAVKPRVPLTIYFCESTPLARILFEVEGPRVESLPREVFVGKVYRVITDHSIAKPVIEFIFKHYKDMDSPSFCNALNS